MLVITVFSYYRSIVYYLTAKAEGDSVSLNSMSDLHSYIDQVKSSPVFNPGALFPIAAKSILRTKSFEVNLSRIIFYMSLIFSTRILRVLLYQYPTP